MCQNTQNLHVSPCLQCHPSSYIRMVQGLIERCLMLHMDREECIRALAVHAQILPQVTLTVWGELLKENKDFFQSYFQAISSTLPVPKDTHESGSS